MGSQNGPILMFLGRSMRKWNRCSRSHGNPSDDLLGLPKMIKKRCQKNTWKKIRRFTKMYRKWPSHGVWEASPFWRFEVQNHPWIEEMIRGGSWNPQNEPQNSKMVRKCTKNYKILQKKYEKPPTKGKTSQKIGEHSVIFFNTFWYGICRQSTDTCIKKLQSLAKKVRTLSHER